jgi:hypothetical protein
MAGLPGKPRTEPILEYTLRWTLGSWAIAQECSPSAEFWPRSPAEVAEGGPSLTNPPKGIHFRSHSVSHMVTATGFSHHFQHSDQEKEWTCWVWEGSGTSAQAGDAGWWVLPVPSVLLPQYRLRKILP